MSLDLRAKVVMLFSAAGAAAGAASALLGNSLLALVLAFIALLFTVKKSPDILNFQPSQFREMERLKAGFFPLFTMWLIVWILIYSLFITR